MSEYSEHRGDYPLSPPQPAYARSNDLDVVHEGMPTQRVSVSRYSHLPPTSHASVRSWVSTFPQNQQPPPPPPPPAAINLPSPVHEARGLSEHRSRPPTGFGAEDEYMTIDRNNVVQEQGYGWTTQGVYPHPMEVVSPRISADGDGAPYPGRREKKGFVGGFFAGLLGRRGKGGGKRKKLNEPMTPVGVPNGHDDNLAAQSGATLPLYSSNPPTPVAPRAPTNIEYSAPIDMPIPEVAEPSEYMQRQSMVSQTPARRPGLRISVTPPSVDSSTGQVRSQSDHTPSVHASTIRQESVHRNEPARRTRSDSDRYTAQREDTHQASPHSPNAVLADIQPTNDYRKMARPPPSTSTYSHIDRVQKFFRDLSRLPWIKHDRITVDYKPGIRGPDGDHRPRKAEERIVILNKPPVRWYYEDSPAAHSVDLLSTGEPSSFSGSSRSRTVSSPSRRNSGDAPATSTQRYTNDGYRSSPYDSAHRSNGARRSQTPPRDSRQTDRRTPPLSPPPVHHRSRSPSLPSSPPDQRRHRSHTSTSSTPPPRRQQRMNRHQHHRGDEPPPVPQFPRHLQQSPPFAIPAAIYAATYIPYGHPPQHMTFASPPYAPHQHFYVMQSQAGSGSVNTPVPTAIRLNTPDPNNSQQQLQQQQQQQQQQSPPPPGLFSGQAGQASPLYLSSLVPMPGYVLSDGVASPTTNLPGQYVYSQPQPGNHTG